MTTKKRKSRSLTPAEYDLYYESIGIKASDLLSPEAISLDDLPADMALSAADRVRIEGLVPTWNGADARQKVDMAHAMERAAYQARRSTREAQVDACLAYLMLAHVRGCEEPRAMMRRIAIGAVTPPVHITQRRGRGPANVSSVHEQVDAKLRARGLEAVMLTSHETTADGDTMTVHHLTTRPIRSPASKR